MLITMANRKSVRGVLTVAGFFFLTSSPPAQGQGARQTESVQPQVRVHGLLLLDG
jgi:hypothetical protein